MRPLLNEPSHFRALIRLVLVERASGRNPLPDLKFLPSNGRAKREPHSSHVFNHGLSPAFVTGGSMRAFDGYHHLGD